MPPGSTDGASAERQSGSEGSRAVIVVLIQSTGRLGKVGAPDKPASPKPFF
jgi:hypothetical protein